MIFTNAAYSSINFIKEKKEEEPVEKIVRH